MTFVVDNRSGRQVEPEEWVASFDAHWQRGRPALDQLLALLGPDIRLSAPGLRSTEGIRAATVAFEQTFVVFPDLTGRVLSWAASSSVLFIEMEFTATAGSGPIHWKNVDRFAFVNGVAVERVAFFNPRRIRKALLSSPAGWLQLLRRMKL